jgi:serine/threonine-protein kinase
VAELAVGATFAGLRIEEVAGRGGMGVVYRAFDPELERAVAVKVVAPDLAADPEFQERFRRESRAAAAVHHPHVIPIHRAGRERGMLFLVMHYAVGDDLRERIRAAGKLDPLFAGAVVGQVAGALDAAHRRGLVHRDVKPGNILVCDDGGAPHAYLTDFGLTRLIQSTHQLTATGVVLGTIDYMAPELFDGGPASVASDVYALGCVLHHALTGAVPFVRADLGGLVGAHMVVTPPSVGGAVADPGVRAALDAVIARAMAKAPHDRYASAGQLGAEVEAAVSRLRAGRTHLLEHPRNGATVSVVGPVPRTGAPAPAGPVYSPPPSGLAAAPPDLPQFIAPDELSDPPRYTAPDKSSERSRLTVPVSPPEPPGYGEAFPYLDPPQLPRATGPRTDVVDPPAPGPVEHASARPRRTVVVLVALLVVAVVAAGVLLLRPLFGSGEQAQPPPATPATVVLGAPVDAGSSVTLSWTGPAGLDFGVDVAAEGAAAETTYAGRKTSATIAVRPGVRYCFQVRGTDGQGVYPSNVQPLRGATCAG